MRKVYYKYLVYQSGVVCASEEIDGHRMTFRGLHLTTHQPRFGNLGLSLSASVMQGNEDALLLWKIALHQALTPRKARAGSNKQLASTAGAVRLDAFEM